MKRRFVCLAFITAIGLLTPGLSQAGSGWYLSSELGANVAPGLDTIGSSNDPGPACDEYVNPALNKADCEPAFGAFSWKNNFDGGKGILAGAAVGYSFSETYPNRPLSGFRVEMEYFYRNTGHDQTSPMINAETGALEANPNGEFVIAEERVGSVSSHNLFGNLFYDFINTSRFTPYVGVGVGFGFTDVEYAEQWVRTMDVDKISSKNPNLVGSVTTAKTKLSDLLFGYQVLFGVDYAMTESISLGLKGRWSTYNAFHDAIGLERLRGHPPNLRRDGSQPVSDFLDTDDIEFFGVSLNLKYHF